MPPSSSISLARLYGGPSKTCSPSPSSIAKSINSVISSAFSGDASSAASSVSLSIGAPAPGAASSPSGSSTYSGSSASSPPNSFTQRLATPSGSLNTTSLSVAMRYSLLATSSTSPPSTPTTSRVLESFWPTSHAWSFLRETCVRGVGTPVASCRTGVFLMLHVQAGI